MFALALALAADLLLSVILNEVKDPYPAHLPRTAPSFSTRNRFRLLQQVCWHQPNNRILYADLSLLIFLAAHKDTIQAQTLRA